MKLPTLLLSLPVTTREERTWRRRTRLVLALLILCALAAPLAVYLTRVPASAAIFVAPIWPLLFLLMWFNIKLANARFRGLRRLCESGFRICPSCFYDLCGVGSHGPCPECGRPFDAADLRSTWTAIYNRAHQKKPSRPLPADPAT